LGSRGRCGRIGGTARKGKAELQLQSKRLPFPG
jgi:hypothetical protein